MNIITRRPVLLLLIFYLLGIFLGIVTKDKRIVLVLAALFIVTIPFSKNIMNIFIIICAVLFFLGAGRYILFYDTYSRVDMIATGSEIEHSGTVVDITENEYGYKYKIFDGTFYSYIFSNEKNFDIGDKVSVCGIKKEMKTARNYGNFDEKKYLHSEGVAINIYLKSFKILKKNDDSIRKYLYSLKEELCKKIDLIAGAGESDRESVGDRELDGEGESGVLKAILFGEKENLDSETNELFKDAGISHILVVSGLHISAIGMIIFKILRKRLSIYSSSVISGTIMVMFGYLAGQGISTNRAVIMYVISLIAKIYGRKYDMVSSLSVAAIILLYNNPYYIFNVSFILSFLCILSIGVIYKIWIDYIYMFFRPKSKIICKIISGFVASISVSAMSAPVIAYAYFEVPLISIILNIIVIPLMSVILFLGLSAVITSFISLYFGMLFIKIDVYILWFLRLLSNVSIKFPFSRILVGRPEWYQIVIYYLVLFCFTLLAMIICRFKKVIIGKISFKRKIRICLLVLVFLVSLFGVIGIKRNVNGVISIDVGQGECILVSYEDKNILIDCGSSDIKNVAKYRVISLLNALGIDRLDAIYVTHTDSDHINGIIDIIDSDKIEVSKVYMGVVVGNYESRNEFIAEIKERNIPLEYLEYGAVRYDGDIKCEVLDTGIYEDVDIGIYQEFDMGIYEVSGTSVHKASDIGRYDNAMNINNESMTIICSIADFDLFVGGDISIGEEQVLVEKYKERLGEIEVYICSHHGSNTSNSEEIISAIKPQKTIISCGVNNSYGHPHEETIKRLKASCSKILRTDELGAIILAISPSDYSYEVEK